MIFVVDSFRPFTIFMKNMYLMACMQAIEAKMKRVQRSPVTLSPPDPYSILQNHPWLSGLDNNVLRPFMECAELMEHQLGDVLLQYGEPPTGIFIIVAGLVKVYIVLLNR